MTSFAHVIAHANAKELPKVPSSVMVYFIEPSVCATFDANVPFRLTLKVDGVMATETAVGPWIVVTIALVGSYCTA